ncbi:MAG: L-threonylcarbamoyladenylate synthase [Bacteriovoracaceae bacterium]|jgi:L-threonylcarbamoyladenylate synthase
MMESVYIYPTDTVWGIGGAVHIEGMAHLVNKIKGHEEVKPLSILFLNLDMLSDYFMLELLDRDWLIRLFELEATLGLPTGWMKKEIPEEAYAGSDFICVRVLDSKAISSMFALSGGPVYTTSFNLKGEKALSNLEEVIALKKRIAPKAKLFESAEALSGHSSTIVLFNEEDNFKILRSGTRVGEIEEHLRLLTT